MYDAKIYAPTGQYIGIAEIKHRNNPISQYPDYQIDVDKINSLVHTAERERVRAILIVSWMGDIRFFQLSKFADSWDRSKPLFPVTHTKRNDRQELADDQYHIPLHLFTRVI